MREFEENREVYQKALRGTYVIVPLKYADEMSLENVRIDGAMEKDFSSDDWSDLLVKKCEKKDEFVRWFLLPNNHEIIHFQEGINVSIDQKQIFVFEKGIAFLAILLVYDNAKAKYVYEIINPGYLEEKKEELRKNIILWIDAISVCGQHSVFMPYVGKEELTVKEAYLFHCALVGKRFQNLETMERVAFNEHKIIDLTRTFEDPSEKDIIYTYGAKDVDKENYRWCACISSQSISYIYAVDECCPWNTETIVKTSIDDLLLTMLVLYQKNTCTLLNEKLRDMILQIREHNFGGKVVELKKQALYFRASGTLAPSQISRWNNVCETYRGLMEANRVKESLEEIEQKIDLIKEEQERKAAERQNYIATVIAVFGLISIIAAVLQIVALMVGGSEQMIVSFWLSCLVVVLFGISWIILLLRKK